MSTDQLRLIPKLNASTYQEWKRQVTFYFMSLDIWTIVDNTLPCPVPTDPLAPTQQEQEAMARWDSGDVRARGIIRIISERRAHEQITRIPDPANLGTLMAATTAAQVWQRAETLYGNVSATQVFDLWKQVSNFHLPANSSPLPHLDTLAHLYRQIQEAGVIIPEFIQAMTLLVHIP